MNVVVLLMNTIMFNMRNTLAPAPSQEKNQIRSVLIISCLMKAGGSSGACPKRERMEYIPVGTYTNADGRKVILMKILGHWKVLFS